MTLRIKKFLPYNKGYESNLLFHSFATNNFLNWLPIYSRSIQNSYGDATNIILQTVNLSEQNREKIHKINSKIKVYNLEISDQEVCAFLGINGKILEIYKNQMAFGSTDNNNYKYKVFISVYLRYLTLKDLISEAKKNYEFEFFIHSDIDVSHRHNLIKKIKERNFDLALFGRKFLKNKNLPLGAFIIFKNNEKSLRVIDEWYDIIKQKKMEDWPRGYGQSSLKTALKKCIMEKKAEILDLNTLIETSFSKDFDTTSDIWLNSNSNFGGSAFDVPFERSSFDIAQSLIEKKFELKTR